MIRYLKILSMAFPVALFLVPVFAFAGTVASQLDSTTVLTPWDNSNPCDIAGCTYGDGASTSTIVSLGTPFAVDTTIEGIEFFIKSNDDGTLLGGNYTSGEGLYYYDPGTNSFTPVCTYTSGGSSHSMGITGVNISNSMQLVELSCNTQGGTALIDHTRPLYLEAWGVSSSHQTSVQTLGTPSGAMYYQITDDGTYTTLAGGTRFISFNPTPGSTVASDTPVTVGATLYVSSSDYVPGMYLQISFANQTQTNATGFALDAFNQVNNVATIPITASNTPMLVSTTTVFTALGSTIEYEKIVAPSWLSSLGIIGGLFQPTALVSGSTQFTVGAATGIDQIVASSTAIIQSLYATGTSTPLTGCTLSDFNASVCVASLIIPSNTDLSNDFSVFQNAFLNKFPWGYATRLITILVGQATTTGTLGTLTAGFYTSSTTEVYVLQNYSIDDAVSGGNAFLNSATVPGGSGETLQGLIEPWILLFIALYLVLFQIGPDILAMRHHGNAPHGKLH